MTERSNIEIDYCPQCRGVWPDRGELDKIIERSVPEFTPVVATEAAQRRHTHLRHDPCSHQTTRSLTAAVMVTMTATMAATVKNNPSERNCLTELEAAADFPN